MQSSNYVTIGERLKKDAFKEPSFIRAGSCQAHIEMNIYTVLYWKEKYERCVTDLVWKQFLESLENHLPESGQKEFKNLKYQKS